ncbi:MAG: T9SS type A sorting domain-containing protein [Prevotella sp.]|nr:T9SS type A sorting domain-containing protein [Prevotella sp.]
MQKKILIFSTVALMMLSANSMAAPMMMEMEMGIAEQVETERGISINVDGNSVRVSGAQGMTLEVVSLTGRHVASYKIESPAQLVELNIPKGCYILKVGKIVRKITIR